ncbi:MAG: ATP-dependent RecD-like DNA helicase [Clostridia bacterium]|nr:ATP-dependent RecD-like DNA helicase [Clostridia bacterium]
MSYIEGTITEIIYRNEQNGYTVLEIEAEGNLIVCVGNIPLLQPGEYVRFYGGYTNHKVYGKQFKVSSMESKMPESDEAMILFLSGGLIKGIGEATATRIVEHFHEDTFNVIENSHEDLAVIKGISRKMADSIHEQFLNVQTIRGIVMQLQKMGLTMKESISCYEVYGASAPFIIEKDPYRLMTDIKGIGFIKADRIAENLGLDNYHELRIQNAIKHMLETALLDGHTCLPRSMLIKKTCEFLRCEEEEVVEGLSQDIKLGYVVENIYNGTQATALSKLYLSEGLIAYKLVYLQKDIPQLKINDSIVETVLADNPMLSDEQTEAIRSAVSNQVSVITGGPGTGKTTILNEIIKIFEKSGIVTVLTAPTGRAAKRMQLATGREAKTIHRLLEYGAGFEDDELKAQYFSRDEGNPIEADAVIVDETSMVDVFLMRYLIAALKPGTRLILTGDVDQLPSVGAGNVLKDIIASGIFPVTRLSKVYRSDGNIVLNAHNVNEGRDIEYFDTGDFVFREMSSPEETLEETLKIYEEYEKKGEKLEELQIICPVKKGYIGVQNINQELRERINPRLVGKKEIQYGETLFREGDKIMQVVNNYSKTWYLKGKSVISTSSVGIYNGDMGRIVSIDEVDRTLTILFEGEKVTTYEAEELNQIEHSYAITVHKSQGSEYNVVIMPLFYGRSNFLTRNLLYTALTRAKTKLILLGRRSTVTEMIQNSRIAHRFTGLKYQLEKEYQYANGLIEGKSIFDFDGFSDDIIDIFDDLDDFGNPEF